ncbi:MAG: peptidoglycan DD-metalloendopeptidase family protein [Alphaproteobacteria bacterium]|nr:peptidoglycan DD-metalloendopeptidase family protein [Alphaproteobacteria bacterium]
MSFIKNIQHKFTLHRIFRLRRRYLLTSQNRLRARYNLLVVLLLPSLVFLGLSSSKTSHWGEAFPNSSNVISSAEAAVDPQVRMALVSHMSDGMRKASAALQKKPRPLRETLKVSDGDTVAGLLQGSGLQGTEAYQATKILSEYTDVTKIKPGQELDVYFRPAGADSVEFSKMVVDLDPVKTLTVRKNSDGAFSAKVEEKELVKRSYAYKTTIDSSLYGSAEKAGIPSRVVAELIRLYSWNVDFQRDIRQGDTVEILYEVEETEEGQAVRYGDIQYANLVTGGRETPIYRYEMADGHADYFEPNGQSVRKALMKTPIDGARVSSGFGMRRHPVLGYTKMHKGVDFAAPTGTPIYAAGDGKVEFVGRKNGYGNYISLAHNKGLKTAYGHMHGFARGLRVGQRVKQGDIIGYVGSTGRATGPHLHFEVVQAGVQVNPSAVALPTGQELQGADKKRFASLVQTLKGQYAALTDGLKMAEQHSAGTARNTLR